MIEFINELVSVEARQRKDGTALPLAFVWDGRRYQVESWGRQHVETRDGQDCRCYLVQTARAETWELCHNTKTAQWTLTRHWASKYRIV
jgi:hypothetical protein